MTRAMTIRDATHRPGARLTAIGGIASLDARFTITDQHMAIPFRRRVISTVGRAYSRDPLERIASIGGMNADRTRWTLSQPAAIALIEKGTDEFSFQAGNQSVRVVVLTHRGEKYLQSEREKTHPDDLLNVAVSTPQPAFGSASAWRRR